MKPNRNRRNGTDRSTRRKDAAIASSRSRWPQLSARWTRSIAYIMIGLAVIAGWWLTPVPIAIGLTILAAIRLWILWREEKKEQAKVQTQGVPNARGTT
ncbi:MAG TPA: hypothetical protein VKU00_29685 [Chthonomonadaceae bacterium]|nr:hypothetical protein [Chthonomonadaceae bacterium]